MNTGEGPNLVRRGDLISAEVHIRPCLKPITRDVNGLARNVVGTKEIYIRFVTYVVKCHIYVLEILATAYVLGGYFPE